MGTIESQYFWRLFIKAGDKIGGFQRCFAGFFLFSGSGDGAHGMKSRPVFFESIRGRDQSDPPCFNAPVAVVFGGVFLPVRGICQQIKAAINFAPQFSLVIFGDKQVVAALIGYDATQFFWAKMASPVIVFPDKSTDSNSRNAQDISFSPRCIGVSCSTNPLFSQNRLSKCTCSLMVLPWLARSVLPSSAR